MSIWYRRDLLAEAGIPEDQPQSWAELLDIARKVRANSRAEYALMFPMGAIWGHGPWGEGFKHMLLGSSTPYIRAEDGRIVAQSQGLLETFEFYETLVQEEMFQIDAMLAPLPHVIPKYQQFPAGVLAMETQGTWAGASTTVRREPRRSRILPTRSAPGHSRPATAAGHPTSSDRWARCS